MVARNTKKVKQINCVIWITLLIALASVVWVYFTTNELVIISIQSFTLVCVVLYLKRQIDQIEKRLSSTRLIIIHVVNFVVYMSMCVFESIK